MRFRVRWLLVPALIILIIGGYEGWQYLAQWESTDDAQVDGHIHPVSSRVGGAVLAVNVKENQRVDAGAVLARVDTRDYEIAVARASAELAEAEAAVVAARAGVPIASSAAGTQIISSEAISEQAKAQVEAAEKDQLVARARLEFAQSRVREAQVNFARLARDLDRMKQLIAKEEISQQQYDAAVSAADQAKAAVESAQASVTQAQQEVAAAGARVGQSQANLQQAEAQAQGAKTAPQQVTISRAQARSAEARVQLARTSLDKARMNLEDTNIRSIVSGTINKKTVEAGQVVQPGQPLMAIIPQEDVWVIANFKETQLAEMRPGLAATVSVDAYGGRVFKAHVDSIASATGAKFSLLPAENTTGNYVKVVQRVPVKILLEQGQDPEHQLRPGMSVVVKVKVK